MASKGGSSMEQDEKSEFSMAAHSSEALLEKLAQDYAAYLTVEVDKEKKAFDGIVEDILERLADLLGMSDMIRSDVNLSLNTTLEQIHTKSKEIEKHFEHIDRLEAFVMMVRRNTNELEAAVDKAESDLGAFGSLKKALNSFSIPFLSTKPKSPPPAQNAMPKFEPVHIFQTEDWFGQDLSNRNVNLQTIPSDINNEVTQTDVTEDEQDHINTEFGNSVTNSSASVESDREFNIKVNDNTSSESTSESTAMTISPTAESQITDDINPDVKAVSNSSSFSLDNNEHIQNTYQGETT